MRAPIRVPSSSASAPSGTFRPRRFSSRPRFSPRPTAQPFQSIVKLAEDRVLRLSGVHREPVSKHLDEQQEWRFLSIGRTVSSQHHDPVRGVPQRKFIQQTRFSDTRISDDVNDANGIGVPQLLFQNSHLRGPADVRSEPPRHRRVESRRVTPNRNETMGRLQVTLSLEAKHAGRFGLDHAFDLPEHGVAHDDGAGSGLDLKARGKIDDVAMRRDAGTLAASTAPSTTGPVVRLIRSCGRKPISASNPVAGIGEPCLNLESCPAGPKRPVFKRRGRTEESQDPITGKVLDAAAVVMDGRGGQAGNVTDQGECRLLTRSFDEGGKAH